ncbi:response regulator [Deinococcus yavapaiensis]|uniref:histidine kinase n=1 Tax=Deinococcus yavapaiensis KR-236 TaxID=694435 RepID=A0A318S2M5_9DEIO|nr:response regulator [Deinococcus yavapaiensis]PYE49908.1 signal transduction histidine kinase [Deinococcus yavapaiensis KR-236]
MSQFPPSPSSFSDAERHVAERPTHTTSLRSHLLRPLWFPLLLLLMIMATVTWSVLRNAQFARRVHTSQASLTLAENILNDVIDLETGERGYVITRDPRFLEPYNAAKQRLPEHFKALRDTIGEVDSGLAQRRTQQIQTLERLVREWEQRGGGLILRIVDVDPARAVQLVKEQRGKRIVDEIRRTISAYRQDELVRQEADTRASNGALRSALVVTVLGVLVAALLLLIFFLRTAAGVSEALGRLSQATSRIAGGDLDAAVESHDITELAVLAGNFNVMSHELQRKNRERDASLARIAASEARTHALINAVPDILMSVDETGTIRTFKPPADVDNPEWVNAMVGHRLRDVLPPHVADALRRGVQESLRGRKVARSEFTMDMAAVTPDAPAIQDFEARFVPVSSRESLVIARDITERKKVERLKNEFVSTVSHELRTPLTSIRGSLSLLASGVQGELPARSKKLVEIALNNSERLVRLINDILDIEKIESGKVEFKDAPVEISALLQRAADDNRAFSQQFGVELGVEPGPDVRVIGDEDRLLQVLTNLISNASKFSPRGSEVTISRVVQDGRVRISVRDRGPGIPAEFRPHIFGRFAQADSSATRQQGGTGLGLSISKAIVERHGGRLFFEDHPEGGTVFAFELPVAPSAPTEIPIPSTARRLLVCEDDHDVAYLLQLILRQGGFESDIAYSAEEAEARLVERPYDALVLDLLLPNRDGLSFIRQLRHQPQTSEMPIIVVSAIADERRGLLNGDAIAVVDWINKPVDHNRLLSAVKLAGKRTGGRAPQVLHVEDDTDVRLVVQELLQEVAEVKGAGSIAEASAMLRSQSFDLVLLDVTLPDGNGLELLAQVRETHPPVPVLVFSASDLDRSSLEHVAATLVKSRTSNDQLLGTIKALLDPAALPGGSHD